MDWLIVLSLVGFYIILCGIFLYWNLRSYRSKSYKIGRESKEILRAKGPDFRWIAIGAACILVLQFLVGIFLVILGIISISSILLIGVIVYFLAEVIIGKQSPSKITIEPALSALFAIGFSTILAIIFKITSKPMSNTFIVTLIILTFFSAIVGEYVGKRWQRTNPSQRGIY